MKNREFLSFVLDRLVGERNQDNAWSCPFCRSESGLRVRPKPSGRDGRHRYYCSSCGEWGDEYDLLRAKHQGDDLEARQSRRACLWDEFVAQKSADVSEQLFLSGNPREREIMNGTHVQSVWRAWIATNECDIVGPEEFSRRLADVIETLDLLARVGVVDVALPAFFRDRASEWFWVVDHLFGANEVTSREADRLMIEAEVMV